MSFHKLFEPIRINTMEVKNRFVMAPMGTGLVDGNGYVTQRIKDYYEARAKGGTGLIIVEVCIIDWETGRPGDTVMCIDDDKFVPGLAELADAIKRHGARASLQLLHAGAEARISVEKVAPSAIPHRTGTPRELSKEDIAELVPRYAAAARRAKQAGFDAVELHGAHRYLIAQFLSLETNRRQDEYGGDVIRRARFLVEVLEAIRETVGADFPVWTRMNARESGLDGGLTLEDTQQIARMAQEAGADAISVSAWGLDTPGFVPGSLLPLAEAIKQSVTVPIMAAGRITPEAGKKAIEKGQVDLIVIGRGLLADPDIANKVAEGRFDDIRPCIGCWECIPEDYHEGSGRWEQMQSIQCTVNATMSREREYEITPTDKPLRIVVVGGGPAGMEAARVTALRGHKVILFEESAELGGLLPLAALAPGKQYIADFTRYLVTQITKLGVNIRLETEASVDIILSLSPDVVIVATGAEPLIPDIPGLTNGNVVKAIEVLAGRANVGESVVVLGGAVVGCETAQILAAKGKNVTVTRRGPEMATGLSFPLRQVLLGNLAQAGVVLRPNARYEALTTEGLVISTSGGRTETLPADTIVLAAGSIPRTELFESLKGRVPQIHRVGDCIEARGIREAIHEASQVGRL